MDLPIDTTGDLGDGDPSHDPHLPTLVPPLLGHFSGNRFSRFLSDLRRMDKETLSMDLRGIADFPEFATPTTIPSEVGMVSQEEDTPADDVIGLEAELMALLRLIDSEGAAEEISFQRKSVASMLDELRAITGCPAPPVLLPDGETRSIDDIWMELIDIYVECSSVNDAAPYVDRGLRMAQRMLGRLEESDEIYGDTLFAIATAYQSKFGSNLFMVDIDAAIAAAHRLLKWQESKYGEAKAAAVELLSELYDDRSDEFRETGDRDYAILYAREALRLENGGQESKDIMLRLADLLGQSSAEGEKEEGAKLLEQALGMCSPEDENEDEGIRMERENLAALLVKTQRSQASLEKFRGSIEKVEGGLLNTAPIEAEIETLTEELAAFQQNSAGACLIGYFLGIAYRVIYLVSGSAYHIDKAVDYSLMVFGGCGGTNTNTGKEYSELSFLLMTRFEKMGAMEDLDLAIISARRAVDCAPIGSQYRPQYMIGLSQLLTIRFERLGLVENLHDAIKLAQVCVDTADLQRIAFCCHILANALYLRHKTFPTAPTSLLDLDQAITLAQTAVGGENDTIGFDIGDSDFRYSLALFLRTRYNHSRKDLSDIDQAIEVLSKATTTTYWNNRFFGMILELLGHCHLDRYHALNKTGIDEERSFDCFLKSWELESAAPLVRIRSGQKVAAFHYNSGKKAQAAEVYEGCVNLMTQVSRPFLSRVDQQRLLKMLAGVASQAATYSLEAGKGATHALTLLELGRGIIVSFLIDCRSDTIDLLSEHPELFQRFIDLRKQMEGVLTTPVRTPGFDLIGLDSVMAQRRRATAEFEQLMERIRALPGHENFLAQRSGESLMALAGPGPIVVVNAIETRCDAIMITGTSIESIKLEKWEWERANELLYGMKDLVKGNGSTYAKRQKEMRELLIWLWDVVVSPILAALGITAPPPQQGGELPQIWWIGTGPMGLAPFHAAGHHMEGSTENTISRAISSYTPNIKALEYSRQRPVGEIRELLLLTMQKTEGQGDLNGVMDEVKQIIKAVEPKVTTKQLEYPTPQEVLSSLEDYQAIHFACHGVVDTANPSGGGLLLQGGRLTVADVAAKRGSALIAYLSACSTAETGDIGLVDEGITLAGAFQMAGFRHVLATMWEGDDGVCRKVAECFYAGIAEGRGVARALHDAVVKARGDKRAAGKVLDWAPFIHNGA